MSNIKNRMANSVDPDETAHEEPFYPDLYCLQRCLIGFIGLKELTLKAPRKTASESVICLCHLLNILADFSNLFLHTGKQCGSRSDCS